MKDIVNITVGPNAGVHDVVFVATQHGSIYAIDGSASSNSGEGVVLWKRSLLDTPLPGATSATPVFRTDLGSGYPETSITGTPIIDPATNTLFVVVASRETVNGEVHFVSRLHALNISDGTARREPALIGDTVNHGNEVYTNNSPVYVFGTGDGRDPDGRIRFNALRANQRPALRIFNGVVYAAWASWSDRGPYHGWVVGWDVNTLELRGVFNSTPNGGLGGIWQSGGGISSDGTSLYFETGNGTFDGRNGNLVEESDTGTVTGLNAAGFPAKGNYGNSVSFRQACQNDVFRRFRWKQALSSAVSWWACSSPDVVAGSGDRLKGRRVCRHLVARRLRVDRRDSGADSAACRRACG